MSCLNFCRWMGTLLFKKQNPLFIAKVIPLPAEGAINQPILSSAFLTAWLVYKAGASPFCRTFLRPIQRPLPMSPLQQALSASLIFLQGCCPLWELAALLWYRNASQHHKYGILYVPWGCLAGLGTGLCKLAERCGAATVSCSIIHKGHVQIHLKTRHSLAFFVLLAHL